MLYAVISPAKQLAKSIAYSGKTTTARFSKEAAELAAKMQGYSAEALGALMHISPALSELNAARYAAFTQRAQDNPAAAPALWLFRGAVYQALDVDSLSPAEQEAAQEQLGILSGLYGWLSPTDLIQPHRLEMGTRCADSRLPSLYAFWQSQVTAALNAYLEAKEISAVINLASQEYSRVIDVDALSRPMIDIVFKTNKAGVLKVIGTIAKRARGAMARWMITQGVQDPEGLQGFSENGFRFAPAESTERSWVFVQSAP